MKNRAGMSLTEYEDFYYKACLVDDELFELLLLLDDELFELLLFVLEPPCGGGVGAGGGAGWQSCPCPCPCPCPWLSRHCCW